MKPSSCYYGFSLITAGIDCIGNKNIANLLESFVNFFKQSFNKIITNLIKEVINLCFDFIEVNQDSVAKGVSQLPSFHRNCKKFRVCSSVVSDLRSEINRSRFESGCYLFAEVSSLQ